MVVAWAGAPGCGGATPRPAVPMRVAPPVGWQPVPRDGVDHAWLEPRHDAVITANGLCHGHGDPPLGVLANDLLIDTTARRVLLEETVPLDGREARHLVVSLRLDGVPLVYDLYVMKKDGCVYDLVLIAPPRSYDVVAEGFGTFVAGFHAAGAGGRR
jgi:hypothetical protein